MRPAASALVAALALTLTVSGCSDEAGATRSPLSSLGTGRVRVEIAEDGRSIVLRRGADTLLTLGADAFQLGVVSELEDNRSYDPWEIERLGAEDSGIALRAPRGFRVASSDGRAARIELDLDDGVAAHVTVASASETRFTFTFTPDAPNVALARVRVRTSGDPREGFYGLGEQLDAVDNRGKLRAMQLEPDGEVESNYNEAHVPVPLLVGSRGWAMFVASRRVGLFDVAKKEPDVIEATFAVARLDGAGSAEALRFELFADDAPLDLYREYFAMTGWPKIPPPWALGPWIWRDENRDQAEVEDDVAKIRALDLATSGIWIDRPYASAVNSFDFDPQKFPDAKAMIARARAAGLAVALWHVPYLEASAEPFASEAKSKGYFPPATSIALNKWGMPIDFTNPAARSFWLDLVRRYTALGIEGFKLDYAEDIVPSLAGRRNQWRFADGSDERTMHHGYSAAYHSVYADALPPESFLLCRAAHWGEQTSGCIVWPGDLDATFTHHRERFVSRGGDEVAGVGGLPTSVIMGLSLSASGFPFYGADTGGYRHSPPDRELFVRWVEQSALGTVMQTGDSSSQPPWVFTPENGRDDAAVAVYRDYARLHLRLFPYEWTHVQRMKTDGRPIQRALGLAYPELGIHPSDEYLFGDDLLVAPVLTRGERRRRAIVPPGTWLSFSDAAPFTGDARSEIELDAPLETLPLLAREGAIIPMLRGAIDTLSPAEDPAVDSFARDPGALTLRVFPGPPRRFDLWEGTRIARAEDGAIDLEPGAVFARGFVLELVATPSPESVTRDDTPLPRLGSAAELAAADEGWIWTDDARGTLVVKLPPAKARVRIR